MKPTLLCLGLIVLACGASARAASPFDLETLLERAPAVVVAECTGTEVAWNPERTRIITKATFERTGVLKGDLAQGPIVVEQLGGTVGNITQTLVGAPRFEVGERSLLLLAPISGARSFRVYGLARGKHRVVREPKTGKERVLLTDGVETSGPTKPGSTAETGRRLNGEVPLEAVIEALGTRKGGAR